MIADLKIIAQEHLEKDVMLCIRTNSPTFKVYGKQIRGKLKSFYLGTIKGLKIIYSSIEKDIPMDDIDYITLDRYK